RLAPGSPGIDAASDIGVLSDFRGVPRPQDIEGLGGDNSPFVYDIGAFEMTNQEIPSPSPTPTPSPGEIFDSNSDGRIDARDLLALLEEESKGSEGTSIFLRFSEYWMTSGWGMSLQ
ncbi:MAG: hypothetical protein KC964_03165, partial [Candidatus Omnitrophica bacterium]|nr:hypothetical protein [Candidatus Omnitrophota bacterium]